MPESRDEETSEWPVRPDDPVEYARRLEHNYRTGLKVWWGRDFGVLCLLDPFTGEVIEVERTPALPKWFTWRAMDEKSRRQKPHHR
jgi:hypothetical protein